MNIDFKERCHSIVVAGRPGTGKTFLTIHLAHALYRAGQVDGCLVMTGTAFSHQKAGWDFVDERQITNYSNKILATLLEKIQRDLDNGIEKKYLLILDDISGKRASMSDVYIELMSNYRHYNLNIITIIQGAVMIPPVVRDSATLVFIFGPLGGKNLQYIHGIAGTNLSKDKFVEILDQVSKVKYQVLVFSALDINHPYGTFLAPAELPKFKIGQKRR